MGFSFVAKRRFNCNQIAAPLMIQFNGIKNRSFAKAQDDIYKSKVFYCHSEEHSDEESQTEPLPGRCKQSFCGNSKVSMLKICAMKLTRDDVRQVALLARLRLTGDEEQRLTAQLGEILGYMEQLNQLDTANIEPFTHAVEAVNALREDKVTNSPNAEALLANAPERDATFFKVPKVLE
jgi:aspartyl-tRNA(Asn)/glutamyl-tRNA(Gln) amidotransferase subunit C